MHSSVLRRDPLHVHHDGNQPFNRKRNHYEFHKPLEKQPTAIKIVIVSSRSCTSRALSSVLHVSIVLQEEVFGLGAVAQVVTGNGVFGEYLSINLGFGLGVAMGVHVGGKVSGAHMNAAVSFTMCVFGRLRWKMLPLYVFAQFLASFLAAGTIYLLYYDAIHHYCGGNLTVSGPYATAEIFATYPAPYISIYIGFFDQFLGTAVLLLCLMALADQRNQPVVTGGEPVGVGLLVLLIGVSLGSNSGYAINPTRDLGPRVFTLMAGWGMEVFRAGNGWWWVPLVAPFIGGVTGALIYKAFVELHHPDLKSTRAGHTLCEVCGTSVPLQQGVS